jgi:hypothetical protein
MSKAPGIVLAATLLVLLAALLTANAGSPIGSRFVIRNDGSATEVEPAVAYNSQRQEYLVVWHNEWPANKDIYGQRVARDGGLAGPWFAISPTGGTRYNPDMAYNSGHDEYLAVWEDGLDVQGQIVGATGLLSGGAITVCSGYAGLDACSNPAVAYSSTSDRYLATWQYSGLVGSSIQAQAYDSSGTPDGGIFDIVPYTTTLRPEQPDLAYNRSRNEFLVVWRQEYSPTDHDIYGRRVKMTGGAGVQGNAFAITTSTNDDDTPAVAAIPTVPNEGRYLVAWESSQDVRARTVSGTGSLGTLRIPASTSWSEHSPAVAGCESSQQFLVVWVWIPVITPPAMMQVQGRTLTLDGTLLDTTTTVGGGQVYESAVAAGPVGDFLVAFDDNEVIGVSNRGIYGWMWGNHIYLPLVLRNYP